jgi:uncharacterized protein (TIGR02284 family)
LDDLIVTTIDSVKGYDNAAEHAKDTRFAQTFTSLADERRAVVGKLQEESRRRGGTPNDFGSAAATIHRRWEDLRTALGGGDAAIIKEIERGEDYLKEEFERALNDEQIEAETKAVIAECYGSVRRGHDLAADLKHNLEATN